MEQQSHSLKEIDKFSGVVVGVSDLLLTSLAKMTVRIGKTVGQVVSDSKVCHHLPHRM